MLALLSLLVVAAAMIAYFASRQPDDFKVRRSADIMAPPQKLFDLVNDLHSWAAWSPYEKLDPAMAKTFSGAASGVGARYAWSGNGKVGVGRMEIVESTPASKIGVQLEFEKPFAGRNLAEFSFAPKGEVTTVTWAMTGKKAFVPKLMGMFVDMDKMIGGPFADGLANLKALAEG